jgi:hypothetical protein
MIFLNGKKKFPFKNKEIFKPFFFFKIKEKKKKLNLEIFYFFS